MKTKSFKLKTLSEKYELNKLAKLSERDKLKLLLEYKAYEDCQKCFGSGIYKKDFCQCIKSHRIRESIDLRKIKQLEKNKIDCTVLLDKLHESNTVITYLTNNLLNKN